MESDPPPPRLSKAYMFGLSNKPWKDPPKPAPLNSWKGMTSTPGAALEWVASDGRKGALIGKSKLQGLKNASGADVAAERPSKAHTSPRITGHHAAKTSGKEAKKSLSGQANNTGELDYKKVPREAWTNEQDEILFRMKVEQKPWDDIVKGLGKTKQECNTRWKEIMPDGFYQNQDKGRNKGKGQGRHDKRKDKEQKKEDEQKKAESKAPSVTDAIGVAGWDMFAATNEKSTTSNEKSKNDSKDKISGVIKAGWGDTNEWNNTTGEGTGGTPGWGNGDNNGNGNDWNNWDSNNNGDATGGFLNSSNENDDAKENKKGEEKGGKITEKGENSEKQDGHVKQDTSAAGSHLSDDNNWGDTAGDSGANGAAAWGDNPWGGDNWDKEGSKGKKSNGKESNQGANNLNASGGWDKANGAEFGGQSWGNDKKGSKAPSGWGNGNEGPTWGGAASPKKSSHKGSSKDHQKYGSERYSSRHGSDYKDKHKSSDHHSRSRPAEYKLSPDDTFSQDELKIIARILQQDSYMVWERVSWRFRERTGRNLHPDVFEKKITGRAGKKQH